jgi:flagellar FliJ protein
MLSYQEQVLEKEKNSLNKLNSAKNVVEIKLINLKNEKEERYKEFKQRSAQNVSALELRGYNYFNQTIEKQIKQLEKDLQVAKVAAENQRKIVVVASQNVKKLSKLEEKQLEEYNYNLIKKENDTISEFVSSSVVRNGETQLI